MGLLKDQGKIFGPDGPIGGPSRALPGGGSPARTGGVTYVNTPPLGAAETRILPPGKSPSGGLTQ